MVGAVYHALAAHSAPELAAAAKPVSAVPVCRSVFSDHIVCLEDGNKLTALAR